MNWVILFVAGVCECAWAVGMKYSNGFTRLWPSLFTVAAMALSVGLLALALRQLPLGSAYAIWTGIGAAGTVICGFLLFHEPFSWPKLLCLLLILAGIIGLKMLTKA